MYTCIRCGDFCAIKLDDIFIHMRATPICRSTFYCVMPEMFNEQCPYDYLHDIFCKDIVDGLLPKVITDKNNIKYLRYVNNTYECMYCRAPFGTPQACILHTKKRCSSNYTVAQTPTLATSSSEPPVAEVSLAFKKRSAENTILTHWESSIIIESASNIIETCWREHILKNPELVLIRLASELYLGIPNNRNTYITIGSDSRYQPRVLDDKCKWRLITPYAYCTRLFDTLIKVLENYAESIKETRMYDSDDLSRYVRIIYREFQADSEAFIYKYIVPILKLFHDNIDLVSNTYKLSVAVSRGFDITASFSEDFDE